VLSFSDDQGMEERVIPDLPILIVGACTTGLTMACELARHGAAVRIIEKRAGIDPHCRAISLHARTLEIFYDLGIVDYFLDHGVKLTGVSQYANGKRFLHSTGGDVDSPFPFAVSIEQSKTEAELERLLNGYGAKVERETELLTFVEKPDKVVATVRRANGREEAVSTPWLIGCDGAHSRVRHLNRLHFPGTEDPHQYFVGDARMDCPLMRDEISAFVSDAGTMFIIPLPDDRWLVGGDVDTIHDASEQPTLEEVQAMFDARAPMGIRIKDARWLAYYRVNNRNARHYHHRRIFLAGDAVHIHSPFAGLGMNTGIQDAYNLAWKLALVYRGHASERLLDSYELERRPVGEDAVKFTMMRTDQLECFRDLRDEQRRKLYFNLTVPPAVARQLKLHQEQLDLDYSKSFACREHHGGASRFTAGPHAGAQVIDAKPVIHRGRHTTLFEVLRGSQHTLLLFPGGYREATSWRRMVELARSFPASWRELLKVCFVAAHLESIPPDLDLNGELIADPERVLHDRYGADKECLYLVRPDGYVGYRAQPATASAFHEYMVSVLGSAAMRSN
jgi:2-polyprenyl-6-methoxyphenol hydroxylase-like FAD-dependent oxidoreductase